MSRPAALRPGSCYPECPPRSFAAGLWHYPMSRPAALRPGSHSTIIIPGPDPQDWTALAPRPRHYLLRVAQLPRLDCAACVRARSSLRPCGASLLALARRRKHDHPVRFSGSSEPWESSLGRRLIIRQCRGERGLPRPCSLVALEFLQEPYAPLWGTDGGSDLLPTMLRIRPAGRNLRYRHFGSWAFPGHRRSIGDRRLPVASTPPTARRPWLVRGRRLGL